MSKTHSTQTGPSGLLIELPECPLCSGRMSLTRIMPGPPGFDLRNFDCSKCDSIVTKMVELPRRAK